MICKYRVTLEGIKGFYRVYRVDSTHTLYSFHKQLRADLEFPADQPILFKAFDDDKNMIAKYALIDLGYGMVDNITIGHTLKAGIKSFVYFYDVKSKKSVNITFEEEEQGSVAYPVVIETKGPNPIEFENGYVAFDDMPEDKRRFIAGRNLSNRGTAAEDADEDLDDEDEDDEDKEEEEIIYDDTEQ